MRRLRMPWLSPCPRSMPQGGRAWYARRMHRLALALLALAVIAPDTSAQAYPARQVRFVVVNPPGIASDTMVRGLMQFMVPKQVPSILIDNRVGADGAIGMDNCARSPHDGYNF